MDLRLRDDAFEWLPAVRQQGLFFPEVQYRYWVPHVIGRPVNCSVKGFALYINVSTDSPAMSAVCRSAVDVSVD